MTWEAVSALGTVFSGLVIALTVVLGMRQIRLTSNQLEQLRRATQLEGAMQIFADLSSASFREAQHFVIVDLEQRLEDPKFLAEVALMAGADQSAHLELHILRTFERVGAYVKHGLLDGDILYDVASPVIVGQWLRLAPIVAIHRAENGDAFWENFEYLYNNASQWISKDGNPEYLRDRTPAELSELRRRVETAGRSTNGE